MTGLPELNPSYVPQDSSRVIPVSAGSPPTEGRPNTSDEAGTARLEPHGLSDTNPSNDPMCAHCEIRLSEHEEITPWCEEVEEQPPRLSESNPSKRCPTCNARPTDECLRPYCIEEAKRPQFGAGRGSDTKGAGARNTRPTSLADSNPSYEVGALTVAALYVDPNGVYANLPDVEVWDEAKDARLYPGPWPVVAHPPCQRWCSVARLVESLHADRLGDQYRVGNDGGCFEAALNAVRTWGGVLEHPAFSLAWHRYELPRPARHGWSTSLWDDGHTTEIDQWAYGHMARKRTWLYAYGVELPALRWRTATGMVAQVTAFGHRRPRQKELVWLDKGKSSPTPPLFAAALVAMARTARMEARCA